MPTLRKLLAPRVFSSHTAPRALSLEGRDLASFQRRALAFLIDLVIFNLLVAAGSLAWSYASIGRGDVVKVQAVDLHTWWALAAVVAYFGTLTYVGKGQTPGKRLMGIRVLSLAHEHLSPWHSIERALGYGASTLELGFGFLQYFIHPNAQTVHDRIAETIVVSERSTARSNVRASGASGSHRSRLCAVLIDCNVPDVAAAAAFWAKALGRPTDPAHRGSGGNYMMLATPPDEPIVQVQRVAHESRVHIDIESDDIPAEVARMEALGAVVVERLERWVVMRAPTGQRFCVVRVQRPGFPKNATRWE